MAILSNRQCKSCGSEWHTAWKCPLKPRKTLLQTTKPMRHESAKTRSKRLETTAAWDKENPPDANGYWYCYISKHPLCPKRLTVETLVREHDKSKARSPEDKYNIKNIYAACTFDNEAKGSLSAEEYLSKE